MSSNNIPLNAFIEPRIKGRLKKGRPGEVLCSLRDPYESPNGDGPRPVVLRVGVLEDGNPVHYSMEADARSAGYNDDCDAFWRFAAAALVASIKGAFGSNFLAELRWPERRIIELYANPVDLLYVQRRHLQLTQLEGRADWFETADKVMP